MKEKIITAFKTKHLGFGLSNEAIDRIASALEKTVSKEEDIENALSGVEAMTLIAKEVQKMRDGEIQKRSDLQKTFDTYKASHPEGKEAKETTDENEPEWARKLREQNEALQARLDKADKDTARKSLLSEIVAESKKKLTHDKAFRLTEREFSLKDDETKEAALARFEESYNANKKEFFSDGVIPPFGNGGHDDGEQAFKDRLKAFADGKFGEEKKD